MKNERTIYLGGPINGSTYKDATGWRKDFEHYFLDHEVETLSPMRGQYFLKEHQSLPDTDESNYLSSMKVATERDRNDIKMSDLVLFNFIDAPKISIGSCIEIGWANAFGKPIICIMNEKDMHYHGLIREMCMVVNTHDDAKSLALKILNR